MMFEVLEPNWHVLTQKLRAADSFDALLAHHGEFLDASLRECDACKLTRDVAVRGITGVLAPLLARAPPPPSAHAPLVLVWSGQAGLHIQRLLHAQTAAAWAWPTNQARSANVPDWWTLSAYHATR